MSLGSSLAALQYSSFPLDAFQSSTLVTRAHAILLDLPAMHCTPTAPHLACIAATIINLTIILKTCKQLTQRTTIINFNYDYHDMQAIDTEEEVMVSVWLMSKQALSG